MGKNATGYPELSFHGTKPWELNEKEPFLTFGFMYVESARDYHMEKDTFIYCAVNAWWEEAWFTLPIIPAGKRWKIVAYTADKESVGAGWLSDGNVCLTGRSLMVLESCET